MQLLLLLLFLLRPFNCIPLNVSISADWPLCNALLHETSEFIAASVGPSRYFDFITKGSHDGATVDELMQDNVSFGIDVGLLRKAASIRMFSARVEALRNAASHVKLKCDPLISDGNDGEYCSLRELSNVKGLPPVPLSGLEHAYGKDVPRLLISCDFTRKDCKEILSKAIEQSLPFAYQPRVATCPGHLVKFTSGFGVSLEVKQDEYDQKRGNLFADDNTIDLLLRNPVLKGVTRNDLLSPPLREPQLIGMKIVEYIESSRDPSAALSMVATDYPLLQNYLSKYSPTLKTVQRMEALNRQVSPDKPVILVNGFKAQPEFLNPFSIMRLLLLLSRRPEMSAMEAGDLMASWTRRSMSRHFIDINSVMILNDLEKDDRYKEWSRSVKATLRPSRSPFRQVARNLVTAVIIADFRESSCAALLGSISEMIEQKLPIRFGLLLNGIEEELLSISFGIHNELGPMEALQFLLDVHQFRDGSSLEEVVGTAIVHNPKLSSIDRINKLASSSKTKEALAAYRQTTKNLDLDHQPGHFAIINGLPARISGPEDRQLILKRYHDEMGHVRRMLQRGLLDDTKDYYDDVLSKSKTAMPRSHAKWAPLVEDERPIQMKDGLLDVCVLSNGPLKGTIKATIEKSKIPFVKTSDQNGVFLHSKGRLIQLTDDTTVESLQLAIKYDSLLTSHLKPSKTRTVAFQRRMQNAIVEDIMKEFPMLLTKPTSHLSVQSSRIVYSQTKFPVLQITAIIHPLSLVSRRLVALSGEFKDYLSIEIVLNAHSHLPESLPPPYFYRWSQSTLSSASALPKSANLAVQLDVPSSWSLMTESSSGDLDNMSLIDGPITAHYGLMRLSVDGSAVKIPHGDPAAGAHILLHDRENGEIGRTVAMGSFGYFQVASQPGDYSIVSGGPTRRLLIDRLDPIAIDNLKVHFFFNKQINMAKNVELKAGITKQADVNVFCLASGETYERLLPILMASARKHTFGSLKFWLVESLVSPTLRRSVDLLSRQYNFAYELVAYNWPSWLSRQPSRSRAVKSYKALLLDVLFPTTLPRIVFLDADQVIRSDLIDLYNIDLQGHSYGFVPFCESRAGTEGYRFWQTGYWQKHLAGRPYFIGALFVADLDAIRAKGTADMLRAQYMALQSDGVSLANLDQDIPNNLQTKVPIFPLPQEWLWCEAWCADGEEKNRAKIIDLCNDPRRKEPKLHSAPRIIPEWTSLDREVQRILNPRNDGNSEL